MMKLKKRSIRSGLLSLAVLLNFTVLAQTKTVTGLVLDALNNPLGGVTVSVKNKNVATSTNAKGEYKIAANTGDVLVFSSVGFQKFEETVGASAGINVTLATLSTNLNEVIVTGYGTVKKKDLTGAITTISSKDFQKGVISTPEQLIQGKVPGLSIISNGGKPGSGSVIRIRGGASLSASNSPLIVIDGVPLDNGNISGGPAGFYKSK